MRSHVKKQFAFYGKSMLWSLLLYCVLMIAINWEEVNNTMHGRNSITVVNTNHEITPQVVTPSASQTNIAEKTGVAKNIIAVLKVISGIASGGHKE